MKYPRRPRLAVWKFASCDGCQLTLLNCEDELLSVVELIEVGSFLELSREVKSGPYDISLVEGSITTPHDAMRIGEIRRASRYLVSIGACATAGGIQALRNSRDIGSMLSVVYPSPEYISTLDKSTPVSAHVTVDYELRGCPVSKPQLLEVLNAFLNNRKPNVWPHSVCMECKARGTVCVMVARGVPCMGPVTHAGCDALCPSFGRGCFGCFGPKEAVQTKPLADLYTELGLAPPDILRAFRGFSAGAESFRQESENHER